MNAATHQNCRKKNCPVAVVAKIASGTIQCASLAFPMATEIHAAACSPYRRSRPLLHESQTRSLFWRVSRMRVYRLYAEEQLQLRPKLPRQRKMVVSRRESCILTRPDEAWSLDFVADQLADGTRLRTPRLQTYSARNQTIEVGKRLRAEDVVSRLNRLAAPPTKATTAQPDASGRRKSE